MGAGQYVFGYYGQGKRIFFSLEEPISDRKILLAEMR
jgi:hypothetical protein